MFVKVQNMILKSWNPCLLDGVHNRKKGHENEIQALMSNFYLQISMLANDKTNVIMKLDFPCIVSQSLRLPLFRVLEIFLTFTTLHHPPCPFSSHLALPCPLPYYCVPELEFLSIYFSKQTKDSLSLVENLRIKKWI